MVKLTPVTMHGFCPKGKQKANRGWFSFSIPATFISGWQWASVMYRDISSAQGEAAVSRAVLRCSMERECPTP